MASCSLLSADSAATIFCSRTRSNGEKTGQGSFVLRTKLKHSRPYGFRASVRASLSDSLKPTEIPRQWYNLVADLPVKPPPPLHPRMFQPVKPEDLSPLLPDELIKQEASLDRFINIPDEVLDVYQLWRPTPLIRAKRLEKLLDTPARIYYKYEGVSPAGSHKPNTSVPQVWYNAQKGVKKVVTETGAGQWGSALAFACSLFGLDCEVEESELETTSEHSYCLATRRQSTKSIEGRRL